MYLEQLFSFKSTLKRIASTATAASSITLNLMSHAFKLSQK